MRKKWFIIVLVLLVVAVVLAIVFINLFSKKDTTPLANAVHSATVGGYLDNSPDNSENAKFKEYLNKLKSNSNLSSNERNQIENSLSLFKTFEVYGQFFERQMVYTVYTSTYRKNRKSIADNLSSAQNSANALESYLKTNEPAINNESWWYAQSWADCRNYVQGVINNTASAIKKLGTVYQASVDSDFLCNDLTEVIFMATNHEIDESLKSITAGSNANVTNLNKLAQNYLTLAKATVIMNFAHNPSKQTQRDRVQEILTNGVADANYERLINGTL